MNRRISPAEYGTHITPLLTAVLHTSDNVFELGSGDWSTPFLHTLCKVQKKYLLTADTDKEWLDNFKDLESPNHKMVHIAETKDWDSVGNMAWGTVFIDHKPGERRIYDIFRFKDRAEAIVVHDTEHPGYGYEQVFPHFKYRYDYKRYSVWTTVVSNTHDVAKWFQPNY